MLVTMLSKHLHAKRLVPRDIILAEFDIVPLIASMILPVVTIIHVGSNGRETHEVFILDIHILLSNPLWSRLNMGLIHVGM
jgi:hypothetical protein